MSEFEKQDQEVMGLVNKGERIATSPAAPRNDTGGSDSPAHNDCGKRKGKYLAPDPKAEEKAEMSRRYLLAGLKVGGCIGCAVLFAGILKYPEMVPMVANLGVLCCGCTAAVILDRTIRKR